MRMTNLAVPFIALLALVAADRVLHPHEPCGNTAHAAAPAGARAADRGSNRQERRGRCSGPEGVEVCGPPVFASTFVHELPAIRANRGELEAALDRAPDRG